MPINWIVMLLNAIYSVANSVIYIVLHCTGITQLITQQNNVVDISSDMTTVINKTLTNISLSLKCILLSTHLVDNTHNNKSLSFEMLLQEIFDKQQQLIAIRNIITHTVKSSKSNYTVIYNLQKLQINTSNIITEWQSIQHNVDEYTKAIENSTMCNLMRLKIMPSSIVNLGHLTPAINSKNTKAKT